MKTARYNPTDSDAAWPVVWMRGSGKPHGVALVATLIMLSLVTFMTVAFLGVARRERRSMEAHINQGDAYAAMEAGLSMGQAELVNRLLSVDQFGTSDPWGYSLFVSTNFINPANFIPSSPSRTNVNDYQASANGNTWLRHLANLQYLPRPPVFGDAYTNGVYSYAPVESIERQLGRFYVDFNRNGLFEPTFTRYQNGAGYDLVGDTNWIGETTLYTGVQTTNLVGNFMGDPQWIGILQNPGAPHSGSNRFTGRYAFLVAPVGKSIDLNHSHNQNKLGVPGRLANYYGAGSWGNDGFIRNQGVGGWELNLAGLLVELNTNMWFYGNYDNTSAAPAHDGTGTRASLPFVHAMGLLQHRWNTNLVNLTNVFGMYGEFPSTRMVAGMADQLGDSLDTDIDTRLRFYPAHVKASPTNPLTAWNYSWAGATNASAQDTLRYNNINDLWGDSLSLSGFKGTMELISAGMSNYSMMNPATQVDATTGHYTWYRMLEQVETESRPNKAKVNLNWDNYNSYVNSGGIEWDAAYGFPDSVNRVYTNGGVTQTKEAFLSWSALRFFTNVAQAILDSSVITNVRIFDDTAPEGQWTYLTNYSIGGPALPVGNANIFSSNIYPRVSAGQTRRWDGSSWQAIPEAPIQFPQTNGTIEYYTNIFHTLPLTNITVYPVNQFTPEVHRLLQVAANLYETAGNGQEWRPDIAYPNVNTRVRWRGRYWRNTGATSVGDSPPPSNPWLADDPGLPAVFRPIFSYNTNFGYSGTPLNSIYISEWVEAGDASWLSSVTYLDVNEAADRATLATATVNGTQQDYTLKGFPVIIGAKGPSRDTTGSAVSGGIPNFNEVSYSLMAEVTRKLQFVKTNYGALRPHYTNQMFIVGLKAGVGLEAWNPYDYSYPRELDLFATNYMTVTVENEFGPIYTNRITNGVVWNVPAGTWPKAFPLTNNYAFITPFGQYYSILSNSAYYPSHYTNLVQNLNSNGGFRLVNSQVVQPAQFVLTNLFPEVQLKVNFSNWVTYAAVDRFYRRVVDYANLGNLTGTIDLVNMLLGTTNAVADASTRRLADFFSTNRYAWTNGIGWQQTTDPTFVTEGISNQVRVSWDPNFRFYDWREFSSSIPNVAARQTFFRRYLGLEGGGYLGTNPIDAPFSPTILAKMDLTFEANDPLVHHAAHQLINGRSGQDTNFAVLTGFEMRRISTALPTDLPALIGLPGTVGRLNEAYRPWGGHPLKYNEQVGPINRLRKFNLAIKDPGLYQPQQWNFPERRFGSLGWMGRVHRGTPWQTIYLKSRVAYPGNWFGWSGAYGTHPTNDWRLFDNLSVAVNRRAASGALSVNQTNRAAWAAVLSGVNVVSNSSYSAGALLPSLQNWTIVPATWQFRDMHEGIDLQRRLQTSFVRMGDILSVPELSDGSPYLNYGTPRYGGGFVSAGVNVVYRGIVYYAFQDVPAGIYPPKLRDQLLPRYNINLTYAEGTYVMHNGQLWYANGPINVNEVPGQAPGSNWFHGWEVQRNDVTQAEAYGFTDNAIEKVPQSILSLVKLEPHPRVAVYAFGQALAPAANSVYLYPGDYLNLVTNYQVIGEVASRTVLRVEGIPEPGLLPAHTNLAPAVYPRVVVEDFKILSDQ